MIISEPFNASPSCSAPAYPYNRAQPAAEQKPLRPQKHMVTGDEATKWLKQYLGDGFRVDVANVSCHTRSSLNIVEGQVADVGVHLHPPIRTRGAY